MPAVLTYDVSAKHHEFKSTLEKLGYRDHWDDHGFIYYFPNTTLCHRSKSDKQAIRDAQSVADSLCVSLQRCIAFPCEPSVGIPGEPSAGIPGESSAGIPGELHGSKSHH